MIAAHPCTTAYLSGCVTAYGVFFAIYHYLAA